MSDLFGLYPCSGGRSRHEIYAAPDGSMYCRQCGLMNGTAASKQRLRETAKWKESQGMPGQRDEIGLGRVVPASGVDLPGAVSALKETIRRVQADRDRLIRESMENLVRRAFRLGFEAAENLHANEFDLIPSEGSEVARLEDVAVKSLLK